MRGAIEAKVLADAIRAAKSVVGRSTIPVLENVRLQSAGGQITVDATNLSQNMSLSVVGTLSDGASVFDPDKALIVLGTVRGEVQVEANSALISLIGRGCNAQIPVLHNDDWTLSPPATPEASFCVDVGSFLDALEKVTPAAAKTDFSAMSGINLKWRDGSLMAECLDRNVFMRATAHKGRQPDWWPQDDVVLPIEFVKAARAAVSDLADFGFVNRVAVLRNTLSAVSTKLLDGSFPNIDPVIVAPDKPIMRGDRKALISAVSSAVKFTEQVGKSHIVGVKAGAIYGFSGTGYSAFEFDAESFDDQLLFFNGAYLQAVLGAFTSETVELARGHGVNVHFHGDGLAFAGIAEIAPGREARDIMNGERKLAA